MSLLVTDSIAQVVERRFRGREFEYEDFVNYIQEEPGEPVGRATENIRWTRWKYKYTARQRY